MPSQTETSQLSTLGRDMERDNTQKLGLALRDLNHQQSEELITQVLGMLRVLEEDASSDTDIALRGRLVAFIAGYRLGRRS